MLELQLNFADHILMFLLGIVLPAFAVFQSQPEMKKMEFDTDMKVQMYFGNGLTLWIMALVVCCVWWFSGRPLPGLGFGMPIFEDKTAFVLILVFILLYAGDSYSQISTKEKIKKAIAKWNKDTPFLPVTDLEYKHFIILSITAGICEEIIFRGYFIQYLMVIFGSDDLGRFISVLLPGAIFAVSHFYQGWKAVLKIMVLSIIFGYIFLETQSLWIVIILHILLDMVSGYLAKYYLEKDLLERGEDRGNLM